MVVVMMIMHPFRLTNQLCRWQIDRRDEAQINDFKIDAHPSTGAIEVAAAQSNSQLNLNVNRITQMYTRINSLFSIGNYIKLSIRTKSKDIEPNKYGK